MRRGAQPALPPSILTRMLKLAAPLVLLALFALLPACASTSAKAHRSSSDREAIASVLDDWNTGWRTKDALLATAGYASDADFTNAFGFHRVGREAIHEYLADVFTMDFVMAGESRDDSVEIRFLEDDVALVRTRRTRTGQQMPDGTELAPREISHLRVFKRRGGTWQIVSHLISDARETQRPRR